MSGRNQRRLVALVLCLCATLAHASDDVRYAVERVQASADHQGRPFAVVDKKAARIHVFDPAGQPVGSAPVLLGLAPGDGGVELGGRSPLQLALAERTTPAGRFESQPGLNDRGEAIVWIDYQAALAIHRLRPAPAHERRAERMDSPDPREHRISLGCVVVPVAFYDQVIAPTLGSRRGVVYVLPESGPAESLFDAAGA